MLSGLMCSHLCDTHSERSPYDPLLADRLETALRVSQSRAGFWGKLGNLLCLLPPLPRDVGRHSSCLMIVVVVN